MNKRIMLLFLFACSLANCQRLPSYEDYLKANDLTDKKFATPNGKKILELDCKIKETYGLLEIESIRCQKANDCETSTELLRIFGEMLKLKNELKRVEEEVEKEPATQERDKLYKEILNKL